MPDLPWFVDAALVWLVLGTVALFAARRLLSPDEPEPPQLERPDDGSFLRWDFDQDDRTREDR